MATIILRGEQPRYLSLWQGSCYRVLSLVIFWFFWDTLFKFFISFPLVLWCQIPISPNICWSPFLRIIIPSDLLIVSRFRWSLRDSKSPQVPKVLLSILADLNSTVVWMVSARPPILNSSIPLSRPFGIVPCPPITVGITVTFLFHSFF